MKYKMKDFEEIPFRGFVPEMIHIQQNKFSLHYIRPTRGYYNVVSCMSKYVVVDF